MALIALGSAKGAPGVTTTAVAMAQVWPRRCIVADIDPLGGDLALRYRRADGEPLDAETGLLSLAAAVRTGGTTSVDDHVQHTQNGLEVLAGVTSPQQVRGLGPSWPHIAATLATIPQTDVIVDCGRISPGSPTMAVVERADAFVMLTRSTLEEVAHLRERLTTMRDTLRLGHLDSAAVGIAVVTNMRDNRSAADAAQLLESSGLKVANLGTVADDPKAAEALRSGRHGNLRRTLLLRSSQELTKRLIGLLQSRRELTR